MAGLEIPEELSIVGFDDFQTATRIWPRLTTVNTPVRELGTMAAKRLLRFDADESADLGPSQTTPRLIIRDSTRKPSTP